MGLARGPRASGGRGEKDIGRGRPRPITSRENTQGNWRHAPSRLSRERASRPERRVNPASEPAISGDGAPYGEFRVQTRLSARRHTRSDRRRMQPAARSMPRGELLCEPHYPIQRASRLRPKHWRVENDGASVCAREGVAIYAWVTLSRVLSRTSRGVIAAWFTCRKSGGSLVKPADARLVDATLTMQRPFPKKEPVSELKRGSVCAFRSFPASRAL